MNNHEIRTALCAAIPAWRALDSTGISSLCYWEKDGAGMSSDPLRDLDAIHIAKRTLLTTRDLCNDFNGWLMDGKPERPYEFETDKWTWGQSALVQAIALLKTLKLWKGHE